MLLLLSVYVVFLFLSGRDDDTHPCQVVSLCPGFVRSFPVEDRGEAERLESQVFGLCCPRACRVLELLSLLLLSCLKNKINTHFIIERKIGIPAYEMKQQPQPQTHSQSQSQQKMKNNNYERSEERAKDVEWKYVESSSSSKRQQQQQQYHNNHQRPNKCLSMTTTTLETAPNGVQLQNKKKKNR